jgi:tetratricopeptide (TPR) repeat protein
MDLIFADLDNQTDETMASMYEQLGYLLFYELRDSAVSIGYLNKAKNLYQKLGNKEMFYDMFLNIGDAYRLNHDYGKARTYFDSCKALLAEDYDVLTDAKYYKLVGSLYLDHSNMAMGIDYLNKSVQLYESVRDKKQMGDVYTLLAYAYTNLEDKHKCIDYNILARDKRKEVGAITVLTSSMANLSGNYFNIEDYSTALLYADSALLYATQCEHKMYMHKAAQQFYRIYKKIADNNNALHYMELADSLNKLLLEQKNPTFQLIENKVRLQNRELLESSKAEISHTKTQLEYSIYISLLLLFVIVIFIFWIFKLKMSYSEIK